MRKLVIASATALVLAIVGASAASASSSPPTSAATSSRLSMTAKITKFVATKRGTVVANGVLSGQLTSGTKVSTDQAPVRMAAVTTTKSGRCQVLTLHLAPLDLELLGVQVTTSDINLNLTAIHGQVLGSLFCGLANAKVTFPTALRTAHMLNSRLGGQSMRVFTATQSLGERPAQTAPPPQSCQVLKLVLGPLHLNLLGLVVDLYGKTTADPVIVTINAIPSQGLLGQLLCSVAGGGAGGGVTSLTGLQNLLSSLGLNLSGTQLQTLLNQLGIGSLTNGLTQLQLNQILQSLGLGSVLPPGV